MAAPYTFKKLTDVEDSAPKFGYGELQQARFANKDLEVDGIGVTLLRVNPDKRQGFAHRHEDAEEVYVVLSGSGRVKLDDEILELEPLDAIRVAPQVTRQFEGGPDGLDVIAFGTRHEGDGELLPGWWSE
ncbi:MAG: cupin domain-containing protein [Thermoleophilaceae bacterium]